MRASNSEQFLTRVAADPPVQEDFGLANGLNDLSNVVSFTISITPIYINNSIELQ